MQNPNDLSPRTIYISGRKISLKWRKKKGIQNKDSKLMQTKWPLLLKSDLPLFAKTKPLFYSSFLFVYFVLLNSSFFTFVLFFFNFEFFSVFPFFFSLQLSIEANNTWKWQIYNKKSKQIEKTQNEQNWMTRREDEQTRRIPRLQNRISTGFPQ